ncbi:MAG: TetR/AcrR family transcriptional regulator [Solirubrobacteraceae bacterium]
MTRHNCNMIEQEQEHHRALRADAERNRRRLLDAATEIFCERGIEVGVGEIAQRAGVGRGTLFRNFPTKERLIAAILVQRMNESAARGREALSADDPGEALFELIEGSICRSRTDRALFDALADTWLVDEDLRAAHAELLEVLGALLRRAQDAGSVRPDVGAVDLMMLIKGVCESAFAFQHVNPDVALRQIDLVRAAISPNVGSPRLRGRSPTLADLDQSLVIPPPEVQRRVARA